ncbi:valine--tRNA ligase [Candidatus Woesearchaeota archaeon]|nr:MAG: valine--tRNA ligase [Candidatus Woesearchaeota archaeon]
MSVEQRNKDTAFPPQYDAHEAEERWQKHWQETGIYTFKEDPAKPVFSVDTPPPTMSGDMHLGHALSYAQQDCFVRYQRMRGKNVLYPWGTDDNGLPTERLVEKKKNIKATSMARDAFRKLCLEFVKEQQPLFTQDWIRLGMSCDFAKPYSTIDTDAQRTAQKSFIDLYKKGLVYRAETPVSWCPHCKTAIAQAEFENVELKSSFNDIVFTAEDGEELVIATTRPELLPACVAVFAHPEDKRYQHLAGKRVTVPLFNYSVPVLFDESVEKDKGTGLMMVCTFGDKEDIDKWHRYGLDLRIVFTKEGKLNNLAGRYEGLTIQETRTKILEDLRKEGRLRKQETIVHAVNVHERCGTEVEYLKTPQWFIKILDRKDDLLKAADEITWYPAHMKARYVHWVKNLNWDWCISRQRSYGVPFPVWYGKDGEVVIPREEDLPVDPLTTPPPREGLTPEEDVMDTWNTSSCTPQLVLGWAERDAAASRMHLYPMSVRPQAHDIIRTWAFYTIVKGLYHQGKPPWKDIVISGHVLDPKGRKMSKSKGNVIKPQDVMQRFCADALRWWAAGVKLGDDLPYMEKDLVSGQKLIRKLWNASKFVLSHLNDFDGARPAALEAMDAWVIANLNDVIAEATKYFDQYEFSKCRLEVEKFFWQTFCDNYLELCKDRIYNPDVRGKEARTSAQYTLSTVLKAVLKLLAPIMPHVTEEIYSLRFAREEGVESIHVSSWPDKISLSDAKQAKEAGDAAARIIAHVRKFKAERRISLGKPVAKLIITTPIDLSRVIDDVKGVTKATAIELHTGDALACVVEE